MYQTELKKLFVHECAMKCVNSLIPEGETDFEKLEDAYKKYMSVCDNLMEQIEPTE